MAENHLIASTKIKECTCEHEYQDKRYGKYQRVMNPCKNKGGDKVAYRCTVCSRVHG